MKKFIELLKELEVELNARQLEQFEIYFTELIDWNEKINLTAITDREGVYVKHFFDSITVKKVCDCSNQSVLDVGSGAGFPSIPLKIVFPDLDVTIVDSLKKRITFLESLTQKLDIKVKLIHGRAEELPNKNSYDIVTARAVANLQLLGELCIPYVKKDGVFISLKGPKYKEELEKCNNLFKKLNAKVEKIVEYDVEDNFRVLLVIKKLNDSAEKYPRRFSKIKSNPL